jgi:hypothetical protein
MAAAMRALRFLVVLQVQQAIDRAGQDADAAQAGKAFADRQVQHALGGHALERAG